MLDRRVETAEPRRRQYDEELNPPEAEEEAELGDAEAAGSGGMTPWPELGRWLLRHQLLAQSLLFLHPKHLIHHIIIHFIVIILNN